MARGKLLKTWLDGLNGQVTALETQVATLQAAAAQSERVQAAALQRLTTLPQALKQLLEAENLSQGSVTGDGQGMSFDIGGLVTFVIYPFDNAFELHDATGKMQPLRFKFGRDSDFTPQTVLIILGFVELAKRPVLIGNSGYWADTLNKLAEPAVA